MEEFNVGDIVVRKSYKGDVFFKIIQITNSSDGKVLYVLKGTNMRILADSTEDDLIKPELNRIDENHEENSRRVNLRIKKILLERKGTIRSDHQAKLRSRELMRGEGTSIGKAGKVLHLDGDEEYLNVCLRGYRSLGIEAVGKQVAEREQGSMVNELLQEYRPDILVLTGHDGLVKGMQNYKNIDNYKNSKFFVEAVKKAREYETSYDNLFIFAGACQSHFEALIDSGANFASSPYRILIHAMDPVFVCERVAYSSIKKFLSPQEILENTITGDKGIGGLEARGTYREGTIKSPYA